MRNDQYRILVAVVVFVMVCFEVRLLGLEVAMISFLNKPKVEVIAIGRTEGEAKHKR